MTPEQRRRSELNLVGGELVSVKVQNGTVTGLVEFPTRGKMEVARRSLTRVGWSVVTNGSVIQAMVKL